MINFYQDWAGQGNALTTLITMRVGDYFFIVCVSSVLFSGNLGLSSLLIGDFSLFGLLVFTSTKSAMFPFSGWLPKAMSAPTPTRALVHRSTLVTAGVVVLVKFSELSLSSHTQPTMFCLGFVTMVSGRIISLVEPNLKKLVAYRTLSQMGLAMLVCGVGLIDEGVVLLVCHGLAKSLLFFQVGNCISLYGGQQLGIK